MSLAERLNGHAARAQPAPSKAILSLAVSFDEKGRLILPDAPAADDAIAQAAWLTCTFNLNRRHPITRGEWQGKRGPDGHVVLHRASAHPIRIEPARAMHSPMRLIEQFTGRHHPGDGMLHAYKAQHCREISYVIGCFCDASAAETEEQEAGGIVGTFLQGATAVEGHTTHGTPGQRYEAACAFRREFTEARYLIDANTGEYVIGVGDLGEAARRHVGGSMPRGWLDARMASLGWQRVRLDGHALPGRSGRSGPHARIDVYRGHLPAADDAPAIRPDVEAVTT